MEACNETEDVVEFSTTIFDLPFEDIVLTHIADYLKIEDLLNMRRCCRAFKDMADRMLDKQQEINIIDFPEGRNRKVRVAIKFCHQLQIIKIRRLSWLTDKLLFELINNNLHLLHFDLLNDGITSNGLFPLTMCKSLTVLTLKGVSCSDEFLLAFAEHQIMLTKVYLSQLVGISSNALAAFFAKQSSLKEITLQLFHLISIEPALNTIAETCRDLECLTSMYNSGVNDESIRNIAEKCSKMEKLDLVLKSDAIISHLVVFPFIKCIYDDVSEETVKYLRSKNLLCAR